MSFFHELLGPLYPILDWPMSTGKNGAYNFFSGVGGGCLLFGGFGAWWSHHNCRQHRCLRLGHAHPDHGRPVCDKHFHTAAPAPPEREI